MAENKDKINDRTYDVLTKLCEDVVELAKESVGLNRDISYIKGLLENHLKHHWAMALWLLGITTTLLIALLGLIYKAF